MKELDKDLWAAFEAFAKANPEDPGARMTLELAEWVKERLAAVTSPESAPEPPESVVATLPPQKG